MYLQSKSKILYAKLSIPKHTFGWKAEEVYHKPPVPVGDSNKKPRIQYRNGVQNTANKMMHVVKLEWCFCKGVVGGETFRIRSELVKCTFPPEFIQNVLLLLKEEDATIKITTLVVLFVVNMTAVVADIVQATVTIMAKVITVITTKQ